MVAVLYILSIVVEKKIGAMLSGASCSIGCPSTREISSARTSSLGPANAEDSSRRGPRQCATQRTRWRGPRSGRNQLNETSFRWRSGYGLSSRLSALLAMVQAPSTTAGATAKGSSARPEHSNGATPPTPRRRRRPSTPGLRSWLMRCRLRGPGWGQQGGGRAERRCRRWDSSVVRRRRRLLREAQVRQP